MPSQGGPGLTDEAAFHNGCPVAGPPSLAGGDRDGAVDHAVDHTVESPRPKLIANNWFFNQKPAGR